MGVCLRLLGGTTMANLQVIARLRKRLTPIPRARLQSLWIVARNNVGEAR